MGGWLPLADAPLAFGLAALPDGRTVLAEEPAPFEEDLAGRALVNAFPQNRQYAELCALTWPQLGHRTPTPLSDNKIRLKPLCFDAFGVGNAVIVSQDVLRLEAFRLTRDLDRLPTQDCETSGE